MQNESTWLLDVDGGTAEHTAVVGITNYADVTPKPHGKYGLGELRPGGIPSPWALAHEIKWLTELQLKQGGEGILAKVQIDIWWGLYTGQLELRDIAYDTLGSLGQVLMSSLRRECAVPHDAVMPKNLQTLYRNNELFAFFHLECGWVVVMDKISLQKKTGKIDYSSLSEAVKNAFIAYGQNSGAQAAVYNNTKLHNGFIAALKTLKDATTAGPLDRPLWLEVISVYVSALDTERRQNSQNSATQTQTMWAISSTHERRPTQLIFTCFKSLLQKEWICESAAIWFSTKSKTWQLPDCPLTPTGIANKLVARRVTSGTQNRPEFIEYDITIPAVCITSTFGSSSGDSTLTVTLKTSPLPWRQWDSFDEVPPDPDRTFALAMWPSFVQPGWRYYQVVSDCSRQAATEPDFGVVFLSDDGKPCTVMQGTPTPRGYYSLAEGRAEIDGVPKYFGYSQAGGVVNGWFNVPLTQRSVGKSTGTLAIDFGTSNSCAYFRGDGTGVGDDSTPVFFNDVNATSILHLRSSDSSAIDMGGLSPFFNSTATATPNRKIDGRMFPTEMALASGHAEEVVGYRDVQAISPVHFQTETVTDFKLPDWSDPRVPKSKPEHLARQYLRQYVAQIFANLNPKQLSSLCLTYPIGFDTSGPYRELETVKPFISDLLGYSVPAPKMVTESNAVAAAVRRMSGTTAQSTDRSNKLVIVLDLGGGTLDVAAWVTNNAGGISRDSPVVLDSVRYAGHKLIEYLAKDTKSTSLAAAFERLGASREALQAKGAQQTERIRSLKHLFRVSDTVTAQDKIFGGSGTASSDTSDPSGPILRSTVDRFFVGIWIYVATLIEAYKNPKGDSPHAIEVFCLGNGWKFEQFSTIVVTARREKALAFPAFAVAPNLRISRALPGEREDFPTKLAVAKGAAELTMDDQTSLDKTHFFAGWALSDLHLSQRFEMREKNVATSEAVRNLNNVTFDIPAFKKTWGELRTGSQQAFDGNPIATIFSDENCEDAIQVVCKALALEHDRQKPQSGRLHSSNDLLKLSPAKVFLEQFWLKAIVPEHAPVGGAQF